MKERPEVWLDTNVIIYFLRTNEDYSPSARELVKQAEAGRFLLRLSPLVMAECTFVLMGPQFRRSKKQIADVLTSFIRLKGVEAEERSVVERALAHYSEPGIDFTDAYLAEHAKSCGSFGVVSVDIRHLSRLGVNVKTPKDLLASDELD